MAAVGAQTATLQYVEPVTLTVSEGGAGFDAYGRRFSLTLTDNGRVLQKLSAERKSELASYRLLRGSLAGTTGSWVRLTETPAGIEGAIWDGQELFAVTTYQRVAALLAAPLDAAPDQQVVYRLSDLRDALPHDFCALDIAGESSPSALEQYKGIVNELKTTLAKTAIGRQVEISLIGDTAFQAAESADPTAAMLARLNIVEGIFSEQLDLLVLATDVRLMPSGADPFTSTNGTKLLEQLGDYRMATAAVRARGVAHLITGKDLEGATAGIAFMGSVCDGRRGVSISEQGFGTTISALIMAHELGHNFGAPHDGEIGTACANVGGGYIMSPSVSGFARFSQCSIDTMNSVLATASCVSQADYADVGISAAVPNVASEGGLPFTLPFEVHSNGTRPAENVVTTVTLPANGFLSIDSATSTAGSCSVTGLTATCVLGDVAPGEGPRIEVTARSTSATNFTAEARVSAANDPVTSNDSADLTVTVRSGIDAGLRLSVSSTDVALGAPLAVFADITSLRAQSVRNVVVTVSLNQVVTAASLPGGACTVQSYSVSCTLAEVPSGATRQLRVDTTTTAPGALFASANLSVTGDADLSNNSASASGWVQAERDVELTAGPSSVDLAVGAVYEVPFTLRSRGPLPTGNVTLWISIPANTLVTDSIDGATCTNPDAATWRCDLGALAPGGTRVVRLRVRSERAVSVDINASAEAPGDGYGTNNYAAVQMRVDHLVDLGIVMASGGTGVEDSPFGGQVSLRSNGRNAATGATLAIELHSEGTLRSATILNGSVCKLISAQRAICNLPTLARNAMLYVNYQAEFAEPGNYDVRFTLTTPGDTAADNDALKRLIIVRPFNDIGVSGNLDLSEFIVGQTREKTFTLNVDRRDLASAQFTAPNYPPGLRVDEIRSNLGECHVDDSAGGICEFTNLPAFGSATVTVTYRALEGNQATGMAVYVSTSGDVVVANDMVLGQAQVLGVTDLELRVGAEMRGAVGETLLFPTITIVNGQDIAYGTRLEVTLPAQFTVVDVSAANALCSGTAVLRCDFAELAPNTTTTVTLSVRASAAGHYTSGLRVTASNDTNAANDARDVSLDVSAAATATPVGSGAAKSGGGGAFEWLSLALLLMLGVSRAKVRIRRG
jgi:hypothetical protein